MRRAANTATLLYGEDLARKLTEDLRAVSHDRHAEVRFSYVVQPTGLPTEHPEEESRRLAAINCGFEKAAHLPPNIGYVKFNMFADPEICALTASAAMTFLADSDALILDLRDNNGGLGGMVEFIASYLFAERTHLNDIFMRPQNATNEAWTLPYVPGKKFIGKPVFVLTSQRTFSAAEDLCYVLKNLQRATLDRGDDRRRGPPDRTRASTSSSRSWCRTEKFHQPDHEGRLGGHGSRARCKGARGRSAGCCHEARCRRDPQQTQVILFVVCRRQRCIDSEMPGRPSGLAVNRSCPATCADVSTHSRKE